MYQDTLPTSEVKFLDRGKTNFCESEFSDPTKAFDKNVFINQERGDRRWFFVFQLHFECTRYKKKYLWSKIRFFFLDFSVALFYPC